MVDVHQQELAILFHRHFSTRPERIEAIRGDGSDRLIYRVHGDGSTYIGIFGANVPENRAFLGFSRIFHAAGLPVPEIHALSDDERYYIEEDFGDMLLYDWQRARRRDDGFPTEIFQMYARVLRDLVRFQIDCADLIDYRLCYQYPEFGREAMWFDVGYFKEMFLDPFLQSRYDEARFEEECASLVEYLLSSDRRYFLYRDFQSRNVLIQDGPKYIDYQSGRRGAFHYDAASLLYDARPRIPEPVRERLLDGFLKEVQLRIPVSPDHAREMVNGFAVLRVLQALGAFGNLGLRKGKRQFLHSIAPALTNLETLSRKPGIMQRLPYLQSLCRTLSDGQILRMVDQLLTSES